jgi:hypothetical protein
MDYVPQSGGPSSAGGANSNYDGNPQDSRQNQAGRGGTLPNKVNPVDAMKHNHQQSKALGGPVVPVTATYSGGSPARAASRDDMVGLETHCFLAEGAKVHLTANVGTEVGLCNGTTGVVIMLVYEDNDLPPKLPTYVLVDFGTSYRGEPIFPAAPERRGWVPVYPITARLDESSALTRTMIPLKLAYACTVWKAHGQTNRGKEVFKNPPNDPDHGSSVTRLSSFGTEGDSSKQRSTTTVANHAKVKARQAEEQRLRELAAKTEVFVEEVLRGRQQRR